MSFNEAHERGELSISQRKGIITLVPKEDGSLLDLSNWRPITLLNIDLKVASKAIAKRIEPTLPNLIHSDQTGFVKGRHLRENIRLISDVMEYTSIQNLPGILTSLDFRKAFDSIEWPFMMKTLDYFNFGNDIKHWIKIFYTNTENAVQNNGFITSWFQPSKGVRQGCPLSPYFLILSAEVLSKKGKSGFQRERYQNLRWGNQAVPIHWWYYSIQWENCWGFRKNCWSVPICKENEGALVGEMEK